MGASLVQDSGLTGAFREGFDEARPKDVALSADIRVVCYQGGRVRKNVIVSSQIAVLDVIAKFLAEYSTSACTFDVIPAGNAQETPPTNLADPGRDVIDAEIVESPELAE